MKKNLLYGFFALSMAIMGISSCAPMDSDDHSLGGSVVSQDALSLTVSEGADNTYTITNSSQDLDDIRYFISTDGKKLEEFAVGGRGHDGRGLEDAQADREVARVLGELGGARLPLLVELLEVRDHHAQQLDDDRRRDVGHDAQRENREIRQRTAREQVEHGHGHARVLERVRELVERDAGHRHVRAETIQREDSQSEQDLLAQLRYLECIDDRA